MMYQIANWQNALGLAHAAPSLSHLATIYRAMAEKASELAKHGYFEGAAEEYLFAYAIATFGSERAQNEGDISTKRVMVNDAEVYRRLARGHQETAKEGTLVLH